MNKNNNGSPTLLYEITKSIVIIAITIVISYKVIMMPLTMTMDTSTLLSLLLALFSVALSALFYFKATDTSNAFYDNTYKFTKEIAELLVKIESGFGEKLRHLDEGYTKIQDRFMSPAVLKEEVVHAEEQVQEKENELIKKLDDREKLVEELFTKAKLDDKQKQDFLRQLAAKDKELQVAQKELDSVRNEVYYLTQKSENNSEFLFKSNSGSETFLKNVANIIRSEFKNLVENENMSEISSISGHKGTERVWMRVYKNIRPDILVWMFQQDFLDVKMTLTEKGNLFIYSLCRDIIDQAKITMKSENKNKNNSG